MSTSDGQPDLNALLAQAAALQEQMMSARDEAANQVLTGEAGGGKVSIVVTGTLEFQSVRIDPSVTDDVEMLEDLVLAALHDAVRKVDDLNTEATSKLLG